MFMCENNRYSDTNMRIIIRHQRCVFQQGVISELRVVGDPRAAERLCEEEEDDSDMVSSFFIFKIIDHKYTFLDFHCRTMDFFFLSLCKMNMHNQLQALKTNYLLSHLTSTYK